jgi:non-ribosomal peptide synthase protein (TIGR01720 family)
LRLAERLCLRERVAPNEIEAACQRVQRSLDLARGPLLRALHLGVTDGSERLLFVVHHLVSDGVSIRFLLEDLQAAYQQLEQGLEVTLPPSSASFKQWASRLVAYAGGDLQRELEYWERELGGASSALAAPSGAAAESCSLRLDAGATQALVRAAPSAFGAQVQDVILAALARALAAWSGEAAQLVELEGHGRDVPFDDVDLTRVVGWFTRTYPLKLEAAATLHETVQGVVKRREALPEAGFGYGVLRELAPEPVRTRMRALPRPRITFNYLGQFDSSFEEGGLFAPAAESAGDEVSAAAALATPLQLDAEVSEQQFQCTLLYDSGQFARTDMEALCEYFRLELVAVAEQGEARAADEMSLKPRQFSASPIVQLASGTGAAPLFCLHPLGGVVFDYQTIARRLSGRRSVYGVQCRTLVDPSWVDRSIEDMASAYARLIAQTQPDGPYHLLGWSFGADLAIETAHVLERTGRRVAFLGLVDRLVQEAPPRVEGEEDEGDVLAMACELLAARYPGHARKELLLEAYGKRKRGEADADIVRGLVGRVTGASAEAQESFDLEGLLVMHRVLQNMYRVSEGFVLKKLEVAPHCWWSSESLPIKAELVRMLEDGIGRRNALDVDVASNHLQIVYDRAFVESLAAALEAL